MKLKFRFILYMTVFYLGFSLVEALVDRYAIVPEFRKLEEAEAKKDLERCALAIRRELVHLSNLCHDYAAWDDTYDFVETASDEYIKANLPDATFLDNRLNLIFFTDTQGRVVWGRAFNLETGRFVHLESFPEKGVLPMAFLFNFSLSGKTDTPINWITAEIAGILPTKMGPMLVSSRPILTSENLGPTKGSVIMGQLVSPQLIEEMRRQIRVDFTLSPATENMKQVGEMKIGDHPEKPGHLLARSVFPDIQNRPSYLISARIPKRISEKGEETVDLAVFITLVLGFGLFLFLIYMIQRTFLGPVYKLADHLSRIEQTGDLSLRLDLNRRDEIGFLSDRFDLLLDMIDKKDTDLETVNRQLQLDIRRRRQVEAQLADSKRFLDVVIDSVNAGMYVKDENFKWVIINSKAASLFGVSREKALGKAAGDLNMAGALETVWAAEKRVLETGSCPAVELGLELKDGPRLFSITFSRFYDPVVFRSYIIGIALDVTEQRLLESRVRENEERLKLCLVGSEDGIWDLNLKTLEMYYDKDWIQMLGYDPKNFKISFEWWYNHLHPDSRTAFSRAVTKYDEERTGYYELEYRIKTGNNGYKWIWARGKYAAFDESGEPVRMLGTHRDITQKKELEEALFRSERQYRIFVQNFSGIAFQGDMHFNTLFVGGAVETITGYTEKEFMEGKVSWWNMIHPQDLEMYSEKTQDVRRVPNYAITLEYRIIRKNRKVRWVQETIQNICDAEQVPQMVQGVVVDVTDKKEAEKERFFLNTAVEQTEEGILVSDSEKRILYANPAFEKMTGFSTSAVMKRRFVHLIPGLTDSKQGREILKVLAGGRSWFGGFSFKGMNRDAAFFSATISPVRDLSGGITHHTVLIRDITHERELERQITQKQKLEAIGALAGGIAHDFNNILMSLMLNMEIAMKNPRPKVVEERLKLGLTAANRAKDLVNQILTFSRKSEEELSPLDLGPVTKETIRMLRASLPSFIEIRSQIAPGPHVIRANPSQIQQILINLCTNAAHAMREKGGVLTVEMDQTTLSDTSHLLPFEMSEGRVIRLLVRDTGGGIPRDIQTRIFDPFFTTKNVGEGTGMGLSVVHGILLRLKGAVKVVSDPHEGTRFLLYFPASPDVPASMETARQPVAPFSAGVMIVDDEPLVAESLAASLSQRGYRVEMETRGAEAFRRISKTPDRFDLVVTDMVMPEMSGMELARRIHTELPGLPVILCTGYSSPTKMEDAETVGISRMLQKPIIASELDLIIREVLEEKKR